MQLRESSPVSTDLDVRRGRLIDAFVAADEYLKELAAAGNPPGPADPTTAERLAIRLLVKHFGWRMTGAGQLLRVRQ